MAEEKEPPPFRLTNEEFHALREEIRHLLVVRTPDFPTALSAIISIAASICEAHLVSTERWQPDKVRGMIDFFAVNIMRSHDLRLATEGGDPNAVRAEDVISVEALKRSGLVQ